jgi:hydrogenase maturation protein HypF
MPVNFRWPAMNTIIRKRVTISGVVQGVGFRPHVWRRARRSGLAGWVENDSGGVTAEVQGPAEAVAEFLAGIVAEPPPLASIAGVNVEDVAVEADAPAGFAILESVFQPGRTTAVSPDIATCDACRGEVFAADDRRHLYPFTNCTDCGPRFTIVVGLPYDRNLTTMRDFAMCRKCAAEHADPSDRRFHAEPNACPDCGPAVWFTGGAGAGIATNRAEASAAGAEASATGDEAMREARSLLLNGGVLGLKGVGGFHLVCDATSDAAVARLRERKHRVGKPLAVMVRDVEAAAAIARVDPQARRLLEGRERPIVLLPKHAGERPGGVSPDVSPGNGFLGVMLPYSPLHHMLCAACAKMPPLVMTSGNLAEEPIVYENAAAAVRLAPLVDGFLLHDRPIHVPCDDSVVRCAAGTVMPIRRSRGYAPLPIRLAAGGRSVFAVGGELKAAVCLAYDDQAIMSQHIGDMGNIESLDAVSRTADHLLRLFGVTPELVAADMHPGYLSTRWARQFAHERGIPFVPVQHHEAHVAALLAEHGRSVDGIIGVCFDGTGFGRDGTIWGGEFFAVADGALRRAAHLETFPLPGGDACIRHPWRTALAMLHAAGVGWDERLAAVRAAGAAERRMLAQQIEKAINCPTTSSMGRLFDAVAAVVGARQSVTYEAEAAMNLEALAADAMGEGGIYPFTVSIGAPLRVGWRGVLAAAVADVTAGVAPAVIAARFHRGVAAMIAATCAEMRRRGAGSTVGLTGGVFQNPLLLELAIDELHGQGFEVLCHERVPANDGGLALGQAVLARCCTQIDGIVP